ncbi:MAG: hypothetical protein FWE11_01695 [Defluviitaleaceae bacterium]|nr:hypothetical protein [Defluviitaleaceae bacterium]
MDNEKTCGSCVGYAAGSDGMYCYGGGKIGWAFAHDKACPYFRQRTNISNKDLLIYILNRIKNRIKDFFYE